MKVKSEKRYELSDLTFDQIDVICFGLEQVDGPDIDSEKVLVAKEIIQNITEEMRND